MATLRCPTCKALVTRAVKRIQPDGTRGAPILHDWRQVAWTPGEGRDAVLSVVHEDGRMGVGFGRIEEGGESLGYRVHEHRP
jgi:hypothetical protein